MNKDIKKIEEKEKKVIKSLRKEMLFSIIMIGFVLLISAFLIGFMHEKVHVEVFRSYGIDSKIEMLKPLITSGKFVTIAERPCPTEDCVLANNINDSIGYHLLVMFSAFGAVIIIIYAEWHKWKIRNFVNSAEFQKAMHENKV